MSTDGQGEGVVLARGGTGPLEFSRLFSFRDMVSVHVSPVSFRLNKP